MPQPAILIYYGYVMHICKRFCPKKITDIVITRKPFWVFCCIPTSLQILNLCLRTAMGGNNVIPEKTRMAPSKIAITIDDKVLKQIDMLVESKYFPNRSKAIFFKE
jgi:hypothetical protein